MKEHLLERQSVTMLHILHFLFLTLPKHMSKYGEEKMVTKYNLAQERQ